MNRCLLFLILTLLQISGCDNSRQYFDVRKGKDITTKISPNEKHKVLIRKVDISGSVMVSQPYQVIVEDKAGNKKVILLADKTSGLTITWLAPTIISICYGKET